MDITINGGKFSYLEAGDPQGLPLVFIHGFPFNQAMWEPQWKAIGSEFRAIRYDLRGLGESDPGDGLLTIDSHVDDLIALLDGLSMPKAVLIGLSMGGYITLRALERNPERFLAAALCDTRSEADGNEAKIKRATQMKEVKAKGSAAFAEGFLKAVFAPTSFSKRAEAVSLIRDIIAKTPPRQIAATLLTLAARTDTTDSLGKIKIPILILVGEQDSVTPPEAAHSLHQKIPGSRLELIPEAGHLSNLENPEVFNRHLLDFLRSVPRR